MNGRKTWWRPIRIENGNIVLLWGDCGNENRSSDLWFTTPDKWREMVSEDGAGLYKRVGIWDFVPAYDPAADCIKFCFADPEAAGRELYELRTLIDINS